MILTKARTSGQHAAAQPRPKPRRVSQCHKPTILIAEHRDEVFARLAWDLAGMGATVFRAARARDIATMCNHTSADLALCFMHLPDESGWLASAKMRMGSNTLRIWLYSAWESQCDWEWAKSCDAERIIYYRGDLFVLSDAIRANMRDLGNGFGHNAEWNSENVYSQSSRWDHL
jgi:hypothetical protein